MQKLIFLRILAETSGGCDAVLSTALFTAVMQFLSAEDWPYIYILNASYLVVPEKLAKADSVC